MWVSKKERLFFCRSLPALICFLNITVLLEYLGSAEGSAQNVTNANAAFFATGQRTLRPPGRPKETTSANPVNTRVRPLPKKVGPMQPFLEGEFATSEMQQDSSTTPVVENSAGGASRGLEKADLDDSCNNDSPSKTKQCQEAQMLRNSQRPKTLCTLTMGSLWVMLAREGGPASNSVVFTQARPLTREEARTWAETDDEKRPALLRTWQAVQSDKARRAAWVQYHKDSADNGTLATEYMPDTDVIESLRKQGWTQLFSS